LPPLLAAAVEVVKALGGAIIDNLPLLATTAAEILAELAKELGNDMPELIPAAVEMILTLVEAIFDNSDLLIEGGGALVVGIVRGILNAIPLLVERAPELVLKYGEAVLNNAGMLLNVGGELLETVGEGINMMISDAWTWGADLIDEFISGMMAKAGALWESVKGIAQGIRDYIGFSEPEEGPLSNFHTYAPDMMDLFMQGIREGQAPLRRVLAETFDFADVLSATALQTAGNLAPSAAPAQQTQTRWLEAPIHITVPVMLGGAEVGRVIFQLYNDEAGRVGVRLVEGGDR
jgi:phage-related protein